MPYSTIDFKRFQGPKKRSKHWRTIAIVVVIVAVLVAIGLYVSGNMTADETSNSATLTPDASSLQQAQKQIVSSTDGSQLAAKQFDKRKYSLDDPASPWVIVNKRRPLSPRDFTPQVVAPAVPLRLAADNPEMMVSTLAASDLETMFTAAKRAGLNLMLASGYRPYNLQVSVYNAEVTANGQTAADRVSARPGFSEHQTGLAVDIEPSSRQCEVTDCFGDTPEGKWLAENAHAYGFIMRYTPAGESVAGYKHESWHFRYVGKELAAEVSKQGNPPLETFFGLPAAPDYQ